MIQMQKLMQLRQHIPALKLVFLKVITSNWVRFLAVVFTAISFNYIGALDYAIDFLGRGYVAKVNDAYLHHTKVQLSDSMLILGAVDAGLGVLSSSIAGISFIVDVQVQVGSFFSTLQNHISQALDISLVASASILLIERLLGVAVKSAGVLITASIVSSALFFILDGVWIRVASFFRQLASVFILFTLLAHVGMPLAVFATATATKAITAPMQEQAHAHFSGVHEQYSVQHDDDIHAHVKEVINKYKTASVDQHQKTRSTSHAVVMHLVGFFLSALVFPSVFLAGFGWLFLTIIRHTLHMKEKF